MKKVLILGILLWMAGTAYAALDSKEACESGESWNFGTELSTRYQKRFKRYLNGRMSSLEAFSHARRLRTEAEDENVELFAGYWLSHAFFKAKIYPMAAKGFSAIMSTEITKGNLPVQTAALSCMLKMGETLQTQDLPPETARLLSQMPPSDLRSRAAYRLNLQERNNEAAKYITPKSPYDLVNHAYDSVHHNNWKAAAEALDAYFLLKSRPNDLKSQENDYRLLAGRSQYSIGNFRKARDYYNSIDHSSNEFVEALGELAWAQLKMREYNAAIGTALSLQTGWLQNTYSPETLMIMAMAFNETCHFPEALRAMELFKRQYAPVSEWLDKTKAPKDDYYSLVLAALKKDQTIPVRLSGEWIRSPGFLSRQSEINEMIKQGDYMVQAENAAKKAQKAMVLDLIKMVAQLKLSIQQYKKAHPDSDLLSNDIQASLDELRAGLEDFDTLRRAAPPWKKLRKGNEEMASVRRKELVNEVSKWVKNLNQNMLFQLADVVENFRFVEIEIYQGASMDMVFSHANPNFEKKLNDMKKEEGGLKSHSWSWGALDTGNLDKQEIWEDELGGFKADLPNRCEKRKIAGLDK